ncbi:universal stress protein [Glaciimonas immobilis]|uniref:Nucleotide-binding universal stress UspA family protein n=1 Tax=Glaciimonas immobilis TaxID=728004 RepID=A0A840RXT0_9BURK|nr:universal stress protein [Glaciimonas immobilis]KAF3998497.1 universal stress protein [Glaciimonas immobilis]MBB5201341.1 nucleotide-binding universal stress UspA family protein [Glaciimonas immobilis]
MFKTILVPTDGSILSDKAIVAAIEFAKFANGKVIGLSVAEPYPFSPMAESTMAADPGTYEENMLALAQLHVQKVADAAKAAGVPCEILTAQAFNPDEEIITAAEKYGCDVIFMASHGRSGLSRLFLGSKTQRVLAHSTIPVLVLR